MHTHETHDNEPTESLSRASTLVSATAFGLPLVAHDGLGRPGKNNVCVLGYDCMCFDEGGFFQKKEEPSVITPFFSFLSSPTFRGGKGGNNVWTPSGHRPISRLTRHSVHPSHPRYRPQSQSVSPADGPGDYTTVKQ